MGYKKRAKKSEEDADSGRSDDCVTRGGADGKAKSLGVFSLENPVDLNSETAEEREKRLAAKKALTLKAFQMTYENHRRSKTS